MNVLRGWVFAMGCVAMSAKADAPMMRDANGAVIGAYVGAVENGGNVVITPTGFRLVVMRETGWLRGSLDLEGERVYFQNPGCLGDGFLRRSTPYAGSIVPLRDYLNQSVLAVFYVPQGESTQSVQLAGRLESGANGGGPVCSPVTPFFEQVLRVLPNDPGVTGVPNANFAPPLKVSRNEVFRNGFETSWAPRALARDGIEHVA